MPSASAVSPAAPRDARTAAVSLPAGGQGDGGGQAPSATALSVDALYSAWALRDPFAPESVSYGARGRAWTLADFNLDSLSLSGVLGDSKSRYALFEDKRFSKSFIFRWGRLYDMKGKAVPGVSGAFASWGGKAHLRAARIVLHWQGLSKTYGLAKPTIKRGIK